MIKIEAITLEEAYTKAATSLECSVTQLKIEVVQTPSRGILGMFCKKAIIVAVKETSVEVTDKKEVTKEVKVEVKKEQTPKEQASKEKAKPKQQEKQARKSKQKPKKAPKKKEQEVFRDTIMPESFVSTQEDDDYNDIDSEDYEDEVEAEVQVLPKIVKQKKTVKEAVTIDIEKIVPVIHKDINNLFSKTCFAIDKIEVSVYDATTILIEFKGDDAALLIGKEGYRYKALSYMIFNWLNTKYQVQLRLEIAEFLKNQEESVSRYLEGVKTSIDRDGRAQTKILDGVLVQIALKELRAAYADKYVAIRTTRDGLKYIIVNDYHNNSK